MPPHGPGMAGAAHSHDAEYPDDEWNLYTQLDPELTVGLNCTNPADVLGIFKPSALRHNPNPTIFSDADEEIMIVARFISPVHIRKLCIIGGGNSEEQHPNMLKCFVNRDGIDFTEVAELSPTQTFTLPINADGSVELVTAVHPFTAIQYIGMQGEHTHFRREAVHTTYEVLCTGEEVDHSEPVAQSEPSH